MYNSQSGVLSPQSRQMPNSVRSQMAMQSAQQSAYEEGFQVQEQFDPQPDEIVYLRKLYFMMQIQLIVSIGLNLLRVQFVEQLLAFEAIYLILPLITLQLFAANHIQNTGLSAFLFLTFTLSLYLLFAWFTARYSIYQSLMLQLTVTGQVLAQFLSVLQIKIELFFHQQALYVLASALIIFQLFIIYTQLPFGEMICTLIAGIIFGFLLVYGTQTNLTKPSNDSLSGSVGAYKDVLTAFLYLNQLLFNSMQRFW